MNKLIKILAVSTFAAFAALSASNLSAPTEVQAADGCASGKTKKAIKLMGSDTTAPASCKLSTCHNVNTSAGKTSVSTTTMQVTFHWVYGAQAGTAPSNACNGEINSGGTTGWTSGS